MKRIKPRTPKPAGARTIRIDPSVWNWLISNVNGFETPNMVLRRIAGLPRKVARGRRTI